MNTYEIDKNVPIPNPETEIQRLIKIANRTTELKRQLLEKREKVIKLKPSLPEVLTPRKWHPTLIQFKVEPQHVAKLEFEDAEDKRKKPVIVHHVFPRLSEYQAGQMSDAPNPRFHQMEDLKSPISKRIEHTLRENPTSFHLYNRGSVILCDSFHYDLETQTATIKLTDPEKMGVCDGGYSDRIAAKVQRSLLGNRNISEVPENEMPETLKMARFHLEIVENLDDKDKIIGFIDSRNTAHKLKSFSLENLKGGFDFLNEKLESEGSKFKGKIGYNENSPQETSILEVVALMSLLHKEYDTVDEEGKAKAPTIAYTSKGKLDSKLVDENLGPGYKALTPILPDILDLFEYMYSTFENKYDEITKGASRLGRRVGFESLKEAQELPLTNRKTNYQISSGILFPLFASFRALIAYDENGNAVWKRSPFEFWDKNGGKLVRLLIDYLENDKTVNALGRNRLAYINIHREARLLMAE